jgi:hypothetical protein
MLFPSHALYCAVVCLTLALCCAVVSSDLRTLLCCCVSDPRRLWATHRRRLTLRSTTRWCSAPTASYWQGPTPAPTSRCWRRTCRSARVLAHAACVVCFCFGAGGKGASASSSGLWGFPHCTACVCVKGGSVRHAHCVRRVGTPCKGDACTFTCMCTCPSDGCRLGSFAAVAANFHGPVRAEPVHAHPGGAG